jgi:hypothetical protein
VLGRDIDAAAEPELAEYIAAWVLYLRDKHQFG